MGDILSPINDLINTVGGLNIDTLFQLFFVAAIMLSGPIVIALLAFRGGDL